MKIVTLIGSRCTYYRNKVLFQQMEKDPKIEIHLLVTGDLLKETSANIYSEIVSSFSQVCRVYIPYRPSLKNMALAGAELQRRCVTIFDDLKPDLVLALADRWEQLPFVTGAAYMGIQIAHVQGGEISGNIDDKIRNAISQLADIHFPSHGQAAGRLVGMGLKDIHPMGCPSVDMIRKAQIYRNNRHKYVICIFHPHTKEIDRMKRQSKNVYTTAKKFCKDNQLKLYVFSGNNDPGAEHIISVDKKINNLTGENFLRLLADAAMIIGNSSAGIRESSYMGVPAVNIGLRQEGRLRGKNVISCSSHPNELYEAMLDALKLSPPASNLFGSGNASEQIIERLKK